MLEGVAGSPDATDRPNATHVDALVTRILEAEEKEIVFVVGHNENAAQTYLRSRVVDLQRRH